MRYLFITFIVLLAAVGGRPDHNRRRHKIRKTPRPRPTVGVTSSPTVPDTHINQETTSTTGIPTPVTLLSTNSHTQIDQGTTSTTGIPTPVTLLSTNSHTQIDQGTTSTTGIPTPVTLLSTNSHTQDEEEVTSTNGKPTGVISTSVNYHTQVEEEITSTTERPTEITTGVKTGKTKKPPKYTAIKTTRPTKKTTFTPKTRKTNPPRRNEQADRIEKEVRQHPVFNVTLGEGLKTLKENLLNIDTANELAVTEYITNASVLLVKSQMEDSLDNDTTASMGIIKVLEDLGEIVAYSLVKEVGNKSEAGLQISGYFLVFGVKIVRPDNFQGYSFPNVSSLTDQSYGAENHSIDLPSDVFLYTNNTAGQAFSSITSLSYNPTDVMSKGATKRNLTLGSNKIVSTSIKPPITRTLDNENRIKITLQKTKTFNDRQLSPICVFWDYHLNQNAGGWSNEGCEVDIRRSNMSHVVCLCNHLTDFSVLLSFNEIPISAAHRIALSMITIAGCCISIVFLVFTVIAIVAIRKLRKNDRYLIHMNLAIALIIANISFLLGDVVKDKEDACLAIAVVTFYFYTAAFFWMLCEGIFIWRALVSVFTENDRFIAYCAIGWGTPVIIVGITAALKHKNLTIENSCWLSTEDGILLSFAIPAITIIMVNCVILVIALLIATKHAKSMNHKAVKSTARLTLILLPLFGATWLFGILAINKETLFFKYIFTILNSLQGFFIFVFYICLSKEVLKEIGARGPSFQNTPFSGAAVSNPTYSTSKFDNSKSQ